MDMDKDKDEVISQAERILSSSGGGTPSRDGPINWSWLRKHLILMQCSFHAAGPGFTSAMLIPAMEDLAQQFEISPQKASYLVAVHVLFMGFAPFLWNMLMPAYGRRPVLIGSMFLSCIAALGGGFATSYGTLMTARIFQGIGISSGFVVPGAVVVDLFSPDERGRKNGIWAQFVAIGSCLGGLIGGPVVYYLSWPWVMWIISIANGVQTVAYIFACPETSEPHRQQAQLGAYHFSELFHLPGMIKSKLGLNALVEPLLLLKLPHEALIAFAYGVTFAVTSPGLSAILPLALKKFYSFDPVAQGLFFIGPLVGIILGELLVGPLSDWLMNRQYRHAAAMHRPPRLESRLVAALPGYVAAPVGVVIFGVTLQSRVHWIAPCIGFGVANFGLQVITTPLKTYCVDCTASSAGSAMQLVNVVRQVISFTVPFWSPNLNNALGYGLGFGIEAIIMAFFFLCSLLVFWKGPAWRESVCLRAASKNEAEAR